MNRTMVAILDVLDKNGEIVGSREIAKQLKTHGIDLTERTVRYHLRILDERGYSKVVGREGRQITKKGREELRNAMVTEKVGFVISKVEALAYQTTLNLTTATGKVILNISFFPAEHLPRAVEILEPVFRSPFVMNDRIIMAAEGGRIGDTPVPEGMVGIGTVCSVTLNGIFLKAGIPVVSRFGGIVEIAEGEASRFTALISYEGSSLDPLEIFIRSKMTDVSGAVSQRRGKILASFREIPMVCIREARELAQSMVAQGFGGVLLIGEPNTPLLQVPVGKDRAGVVVVGGLNPIAALEEHGIPTESTAMSTLHEYATLQTFTTILKESA